MSNLLPKNFTDLFGATVAIIAGMWAILSFYRNNRTKAAEILINIEKEYSKHIPTLLQLENMTDYTNIYKEALKISYAHVPDKYTKEESDAIDRLEGVLRHFFVCFNVRLLGVDSGAIDQLCAWYLRVLVTDLNENGELKRPELNEYIRRYWPTIYFWAPLAPAPWPKRTIILMSQIPKRLRYWWAYPEI